MVYYMKIRRGFVTNSSSTNDIFTALGTAAAAAVLGTVINVVKVSKTSRLVSYALLETTHVPEDPRPPRVRVNDAQYVAWFYAGVRCIDVMFALDEGTGEETTSVVGDEYNDEYTSQIQYSLPDAPIMEWLTFGAYSESPSGEKDYTSMDGKYKTCGFMCQSIYNDSPRRQRKAPPGDTLSFTISVTINEKTLSKTKQCNILDEADLYAYDGQVLNDSSLPMKLLVNIVHRGHYSWNVKYEPLAGKPDDYCEFSFEDAPTNNPDQVNKYLVVTPKGKKLTFDGGAVANDAYVSLTIIGTPNASHIPEVSDNLNITILEEGLYLASGVKDKEGRFCVNANIDESKGETEYHPSRFEIGLIVKNEDSEKGGSTAKYIDMKEASVELGELEGTDSDTDNLAKVFKYKIDKMTAPGTYEFLPQLEIPERKIPYIMKLPIKAEYNGETYELDLPVRLLGQPYDAKQAWSKEYENLIKTIKKYLPQEEWAPILEDLEKRKDRLSVEMLRLKRRSIFETARDKLLKEAEGYEQIANVLDWTVTGLEAVKWVGDQAFSYLMATYTGPVGEALIVPFKDVMTMILAEYAGQIVFGTGSPYKDGEIVRGALSNVFTAFENYLMMDSDKKVSENLDVKKLGMFLAAFSTWKFMNHYFFDRNDNDEPIGIWDAIIETCKDLTTNCFKILVTKKLEAAISSDKAKEIYQKYLTEQVKKYLTQVCPDWQKKGMDIAAKYISEFGGLVSSPVYGATVEKAGQVEIKSTENDIIITINLYNEEKNPWLYSFSLNAVKEKLYDYIYDSIFSFFPFATSPITVPDDPTFYKAS